MIAAVYLLRVLRQLWHGPVGSGPSAGAEPDGAPGVGADVITGRFIGDATGHEVAVAAPLVLATIALGLLPAILLQVTGPAVRLMLGGTP